MSVITLIVGCGYLGSRVGEQLARRGERVAGTVRSTARAEMLRRQGIEPVLLDVLDPATLDHLPKADRVLYAVGFDRGAGVAPRRVYVEGLANVLERLSGRAGRLVYTSSTGVYGDFGGGWVDEESPTEPLHEAGRVALEAETLLRVAAERLGLSTIILRLAGLYGPGRIPGRAGLERGEPVVGDPDRPLNLVHIDDAAEAVIAALDRARPGRTYLIGDDRPVPRHDYYTTAARLLGAPPPQFIPAAPGSPAALRESSSKRIANRRMRSELAVTLTYPDLSTGLPAALGLGPAARMA